MRNLKLSILVAVTTAAVISITAATASATTLTGSGGTTLGTGTTVTAESEGKVTYDPPFGKVECNSSFSGKTSNAGGEGVNVNVSVESLSYTECNSTDTVLVKGTLSIEGVGSNNGTLRSSGTELTIELLGSHCIFKTTETDLGTLTGSATTGGNATLDISATIPRTGGRSGAFCGSTAQWTGSYKFTAPSTLNIDNGPGVLKGEVPTGTVGETYTVTWKNTGGSSLTVEDESDSDATIAETTGSGCGTIAAGGSCTSRKVKCLKEGEATLVARDTPSVEGEVKIKCDKPIVLKGKVTSPGVVGETYTITWENTGTGTASINDETNSSSTVAETTGTACTTIAGGGSCTTKKVKCLKTGEATLTIRDTTNSAEASVTIKCENILEGGPSTGKVGETVTVTWTNNAGSSLVIEDESTSDGTVAETLGSSCGTIASKGSCTSRKIKCLKAGESTITAVDTPSVEGKFVIKCS